MLYILLLVLETVKSIFNVYLFRSEELSTVLK
jgi:hypothetical protein